MNDDAQLIDDTLAGNRAAFGELVRKYEGRLFNTLMHVVGSREEAEDVAQEAFVQAFVKLDSFRGRSAFYTWLYRIAFNVSVSRATSSAVGGLDGPAPGADGGRAGGRGGGPKRADVGAEQVRQVREAIEELTRRAPGDTRATRDGRV